MHVRNDVHQRLSGHIRAERAMRPCQIILASGLLFAASAVPAQNLVVNGGFDANTAGWQLDGFGTLAWSPLDAGGQPASGSAQLTNTNANTGNGTLLAHCVEVTPGTLLQLGVKVRVPSGVGQTLSNLAYGAYRFHAGPGCVSSVTGVVGFGAETPGQLDTWQAETTQVIVPAGATRIEIRGIVIKFVAGSNPVALFDDFTVVPLDVVFASGFE
jgi:hypothetical protein